MTAASDNNNPAYAIGTTTTPKLYSQQLTVEA